MDNTSLSLEYYFVPYGRFIKDSTIYNNTKINKIINLNNFQIPLNSVFHIFDNFDNNITSEMFRLDKHRFINKQLDKNNKHLSLIHI